MGKLNDFPFSTPVGSGVQEELGVTSLAINHFFELYTPNGINDFIKNINSYARRKVKINTQKNTRFMACGLILILVLLNYISI